MLNITKRTAYIILAISIVFEIIGDAALEACHGFSFIGMSVLAFALIGLAFYSLANILHIVKLPVAYATWSASGTIACTLLGVFFFKQPLSPVGWIAMAGLTIGVFILNMWGMEEEKEGDK